MSEKEVESVKSSLGRSLHNGDVFGTFYNMFLECDNRVTEQFAETDWEEQKRLLRQGVNKVIGFWEGSFTSQKALERIRYTHGKDRLNIPPDLYGCWVESMIAAVKRYDPDFDPALEQQWRDVLWQGAEFIKAGFEE